MTPVLPSSSPDWVQRTRLVGTPANLVLLVELRRTHPESRSQTDLATATGLSITTTASALARLVAAGLVTTSDPAGQRRFTPGAWALNLPALTCLLDELDTHLR